VGRRRSASRRSGWWGRTGFGSAFPPTGRCVCYARTELTISRFSPVELYDGTASALLDPGVRSVGLVTLAQLDRAVVSDLSLGQSLLLVWPQLVGLAAATVVIFAFGYVAFMKQEVRA